MPLPDLKPLLINLLSRHVVQCQLNGEHTLVGRRSTWSNLLEVFGSTVTLNELSDTTQQFIKYASLLQNVEKMKEGKWDKYVLSAVFVHLCDLADFWKSRDSSVWNMSLSLLQDTKSGLSQDMVNDYCKKLTDFVNAAMEFYSPTICLTEDAFKMKEMLSSHTTKHEKSYTLDREANQVLVAPVTKKAKIKTETGHPITKEAGQVSTTKVGQLPFTKETGQVPIKKEVPVVKEEPIVERHKVPEVAPKEPETKQYEEVSTDKTEASVDKTEASANKTETEVTEKTKTKHSAKEETIAKAIKCGMVSKTTPVSTPTVKTNSPSVTPKINIKRTSNRAKKTESPCVGTIVREDTSSVVNNNEIKMKRSVRGLGIFDTAVASSEEMEWSSDESCLIQTDTVVSPQKNEGSPVTPSNDKALDSSSFIKKGAWSDEESKCLMQGVEIFGEGRWKEIKASYPLLRYRKTNQLKDRYRNIKGRNKH